MAKCKTCGKTIRVPAGWTVGPAARKHYWRNHPEVMEGPRVDKAAEKAVQARPKGSRK